MTLEEFKVRDLNLDKIDFEDGRYYEIWLERRKLSISLQDTGWKRTQICQFEEGMSWRFMYLKDLNQFGEETKLLGDPTNGIFSLGLAGKKGVRNSIKLINYACKELFSQEGYIVARSINYEEAKILPLEARRQGDYWIPKKHKMFYGSSCCSFGLLYSGNEIYLENSELFYSHKKAQEVDSHPVRPVISIYSKDICILSNKERNGSYEKPYQIIFI